MTAWVDFAAAGFSIEQSRDWPRLLGPPDDAGRLADLRFEIESRIALVGDGVDFATRNASREPRCSHCGDRMPFGTYGTCGLCVLARAKALRLREERAQ